MVSSINGAVQSLGTTDIETTNENVAGSDALAAQGRLADDFDQFLLLLTTQLQNQNPTDPLDTNEFTNQLVQFASVEQLVAQSGSLENLVDASKEQDQANAVNFAGKIVEVEGNNVVVNEGGDVYFSYTIDEGEIDRTDILLEDAAGNVVFTGQGETGVGKHAAGISASDLANANVQPGIYTLKINTIKNGENGGGDVLGEATVYTSGIVTEVKLNGEEITLSVNGEDVPVSKVITVGLDVTNSITGGGGSSNTTDEEQQG